MRVALIPPAGLLHFAVDQPLHMIIPEGLKVLEYKYFYKVLSQASGTTLMLDNGAYEESNRKALDNDQLVQLIYSLGADIFVLPDAMRDRQETTRLAESFMHYWEIYHALLPLRPIQFMGVVQGTSLEDMKRCVSDFVALEEEFEVSMMIGLSKWTSQELMPDIRLQLASWVYTNAPHSIHLLGMSRVWPEEVIAASQYLPNIVSIDATSPFTYAMSGLKLGVDDGPGRPVNYFGADTRNVDRELLKANLNTLWSWADGKES
jgi:hypothetical protein